ncbi:AAA family ATPase [Desulfogranum marinum]|uniref:AAA family ATPase n=1 Tax=Desulfogranum marinum TaxID=453220 RepID=UPI0019657C2B|nr:AAA family ATPase [Desulfogranum marinum]MBM9515230.1 AAA family ATPase [Desulfogranum marinum]
MSTTEAKRNVIDFLWDWAESAGNWAKLLVHKVVSKEDALVEDDRKVIYKAFLHDTGLATEEKEIPEITRPKFSTSEVDIELVKISNVCGVNRLAPGQSLKFSPNMTVVYGENGSGKTGYGRVLKNFGYCYDTKTKIHPDVNGDCDCKQSVLIDYKAEGSDKVFTWDGANECIDLAGVSFFNNNCVHLSLDAERHLLVSPIGFHLFAVLIDELAALATFHKSRIDFLDTSLYWQESLHEDTEVQKLVTSLTKDTKDEDITPFESFTEEQERDLKTKKEAIRKASKELIEKNILELNQFVSDLNRIKTVVEGHKNQITEKLIADFASNLSKFEKLKNKEQVGIKDIVEKKGVELYGSPEFMTFIKAADQYIAKLDKKDYPSSDDEVCVYCQQKLSDKSSLELLKSYRKVLNDTTQQDIQQVQGKISSFSDDIIAVSEDNKFYQAVFGADEKAVAIQPVFLKTYNTTISDFKKLIAGKDTKAIKAYKLLIPFDNTVSLLDEKITSLAEDLEGKKQTLSTLKEVESTLQKAINELEDRKKFSEKKADVKTVISKLKIKHALEFNTKKFSSRPISTKTTAARGELLEKEFRTTFDAELKSFRRSTTPVGMTFRTDKGQSKIVQFISDGYKLNEILSEGEQKAIALAEFLTELKFDKRKSPAVFDDPVTSLDHKIIEEVARRLLKLSKERQVVIFTHSILLLNSIRQLSSSPLYSGIDLIMYEVQKDEKNTGYLQQIRSPKEESFSKIKKEINNIFNLPAKERNEQRDRLAAKGYGSLRSLIEVLVEMHMLCGTVKRYQRNVSVTNFEKIKTDKIDQHRERLSSIFSRCCGFIDGHTNPEEIADKPDLDSLKIDFKEVITVSKDFI